MKMNWYEVWADEGHQIPYVLLLRSAGEIFEVLDPANGYKRVFESSTYEGTRMWLLEDEYVLVARKEVDD